MSTNDACHMPGNAMRPTRTAPPNGSGFARFSPAAARCVLIVAAAIALAAVGVTLSPLARSNFDCQRSGGGDVALYRAEIARMRTGSTYYAAAAAELRAFGYPTRNVFNWRTPLPMWLIAKLPPGGGKLLLAALAMLLIVLAFEATARDSASDCAPYGPGHASTSVLHGCAPQELTAGRVGPPWTAVAAAALLTGPLLFTVVGELYVMPALWAGVLIGLSICCLAMGRGGWGVAFGIAAVFTRELALPYGLLAMTFAVGGRRWREALGWIVGLAAWSAMFAVHAHLALSRVQPGDHAHAASWIQCGGAGFVLSTIQMNAYLLLLPQWATALFAAAALVGFADWNTPLGRRVVFTAMTYAIVFAVVGQEFNQYWGCLIAPLWCLGAARAPSAIARLAVACR